MNGLRRNSRNVQCRKYQQVGSQSVRRKSGGDGKRLQERGVGLHTWLPGLTGNSLPCKEQSIAGGAAGGTVAKDSGVVIK